MTVPLEHDPLSLHPPAFLVIAVLAVLAVSSQPSGAVASLRPTLRAIMKLLASVIALALAGFGGW